MAAAILGMVDDRLHCVLEAFLAEWPGRLALLVLDMFLNILMTLIEYAPGEA